MRSLFLLLLAGMAVCLVVSCGSDDDPLSSKTINGNGTMATDSRTLSSFHAVRFMTVGAVTVAQDSPQSVVITVDENVIHYITTSILDGELIIGLQDGIAARDFDLQVAVVADSITSLHNDGIGSVSSQNQIVIDTLDIGLGSSGVGSIAVTVEADYVSSALEGVGSINLSGSAHRHVSGLTAVGSLDAFGLVTDTTLIILSGQGNANVYAENYLDVLISGNGTVTYRGNPHKDISITGVGRVIDGN